MNNILRGKIIERFGSLSKFATAMGLSPATLSWRMTGRAEWKRDEIVKAIKLLGIHPTEIALYFFIEILDVSEGQSNG